MRASSKYSADGSGTGENSGLIIENERLKTSIMVLSQKLQAQNHTSDENKKLELNERKHRHDADELGIKCKLLEAEVSDLKANNESTVSQYEAKIATTVSNHQTELANRVSSSLGYSLSFLKHVLISFLNIGFRV